MQSKQLHVAIRAVALVALALVGACSGMASNRDDRLFVPEGLPNANLDGEDVGLTLLAFTLVRGTGGPALYAAVKNEGDAPACQAGMTTEFYDKAGQHVTSAGAVLQTDRFYRLPDGTIISCIDPGQISMAASTALPDVDIDNLGSLQHLFPSFTLQGIVPVAGLAISDVRSVVTEGGSAYIGNLSNGLEVAVSAASAMIFPVNRVGRPLGAAASNGTSDIPSGGSWTFETNSVDAIGVDDLAFPAATISQ